MQTLRQIAQAINSEHLRRSGAPDPATALILDALRDAIFVKNAEGRYLYANIQAALNFDTTPERIIGLSASDFMPEDAAAMVAAIDRNVVETNMPVSVEYETTWHTPPRNYVVNRVPLQDCRGTVIGIIGAAYDITERKQAEQQVSEQAAAKSRFFAAASHDLRQPLQSLFLSADSLKRYLSADSQPAFLQLERGLDLLKTLLDNLMDVSRLDQHLIRPVLESFTVADLFADLNDGFAGPARLKNLRLVVASSPLWVYSDRLLLHRLLANVVENAVKYTCTGSVTLRADAEGDHVLISVVDTGIGIPESMLDTVWDEFVQVGNAERNRAEGLGLGLSVVRRLGTLLRHPITLRSDLGRGTRFQIAVSGRTDPVVVAPPVAAPPDPVPKTYAVVVDDDALLRETLEMSLQEWGFQVVIAASTEQALAALHRDAVPDILLLDYRLVEETGIDAVTRLRGFFGHHIPAILLTGDPDDSVRELARLHDMRLLFKPARLSQLRTAIADLTTPQMAVS